MRRKRKVLTVYLSLVLYFVNKGHNLQLQRPQDGPNIRNPRRGSVDGSITRVGGGRDRMMKKNQSFKKYFKHPRVGYRRHLESFLEVFTEFCVKSLFFNILIRFFFSVKAEMLLFLKIHKGDHPKSYFTLKS